MKKNIFFLIAIMLCAVCALPSCSKDEPANVTNRPSNSTNQPNNGDNNQNNGDNNGQNNGQNNGNTDPNNGQNGDNNGGNNTNDDTVKEDGNSVVSADGLIFKITSDTDKTAELTGTASTINKASYAGGFDIPEYIKYKSVVYYVTSIGPSAFDGFAKMTSIKLPARLTSIGDKAFNDCKSLTDITIPTTVNNIGKSAFAATCLRSVSLPSGLKEIQESVFAKCNILSNVTIPASVTKIGSYAFSDCSSLNSIIIPSSVTEIASYAFTKSNLRDVTIPNSVTKIGVGAFLECTAMSSVVLPNSITTIPGSAFENCYALSKISMPKSVKEIGEAAFSGSISLKEITIPESVNKIGSQAFYYANLENIKVESSTPPTCTNPFEDRIYDKATLNVPKSSIDKYKSTSPWKNFKNITYDGYVENKAPVAVDLGLSVKWSPVNLGAEKSSDCGDYYAWGETQTKSSYSIENCKWLNVSNSYLQSHGVIDSDNNLTAEYDAAAVNWGGTWHIPTYHEMMELISDCTWVWTVKDGREGYDVIGPNKNKIFLPSTGYRDGTNLSKVNSQGYYWLASPYVDGNAYCFLINSKELFISYKTNLRALGYAIRPVCR